MSQPVRKTHKVINASNRQTVKRLNQKDLDTSCFRLSRVAQKYKSNRAVKQEEQRSFIDRFYSENPDALDTRSPDEKLEEIQEQLQDENLEPHDRFLLITQQKQLNSLKYGEESAEVMQCEIQQGIYYNESGRPKSAIRHLQKAHQLEGVNETTPEDSVIIAVEAADAYLTIHESLKKSEAMKNLNRANELLKPVAEVQLDDTHLTFRRDIDIARVSALKSKFTDAMPQYEKALSSLEADGKKDTVEYANVLCEMGENAAFAKEQEKSKDYYFSAFQIYRSLNMTAEAEAILPKFKTEEEEEEKHENKEEEEEKPEDKEKEEGVLEKELNNIVDKTLNDDNKNEKDQPAKLDDVLNDALTKNENENEKNENEKDKNETENDPEISDDFLDGTMKSSTKEEEKSGGEEKNNTDDGPGKAESLISGISGNLMDSK